MYCKEPVPEDEYTLPIGKASVKRGGSDITIVAWSYMVGESLMAADKLSNEGIETEVILIPPGCLPSQHHKIN
jgi:pyruvate dehydrogenase E1 component beta subunit